jgi:hypothetical protein
MNRKLNIAAIGLGFALFLIPQFSQAAERDNGYDRDRYDRDRGREDNFDRGGSFHDKCERINIRYDEHGRDRDRDRDRDHDRGHDEHCQVVSPNRPHSF